MSHRLRTQMTKIFFEDDGCPSQPNNKEEKTNLFDELGGIPAPESDDWDDEDEHADKRRSSRSDFFHFWGCPWRSHDEETNDRIYEIIHNPFEML